MSAEAGDLAGAIASLRADLESAIREGQGHDVQFGLGDVELTLQLVATKHGGGKVGWSVLGVDAGVQNERTHTVKLTGRTRARWEAIHAAGAPLEGWTLWDPVDAR